MITPLSCPGMFPLPCKKRNKTENTSNLTVPDTIVISKRHSWACILPQQCSPGLAISKTLRHLCNPLKYFFSIHVSFSFFLFLFKIRPIESFFFFFYITGEFGQQMHLPLHSSLDLCIVYETRKFFNKANVTFKLGLTGTIYSLKIILL